MANVCCVYVEINEPNVDLSSDLVEMSLQRLDSFFTNIPVYYSSKVAILEADRLGATHIELDIQVNSLKKILTRHAKDDQDSLALFYNFYPVLDLDLCAQSLERHNRYLAHLTYGENIPLGFIPDFLSYEFIKLLPDGLETKLREFVFKNIETYDLELFYKLPDLRQLRLDLSTKTPRSIRLLNDLIKVDPLVNYSTLQKLLLDHPCVMRPYPSCFEVELTGHRAVDPIYKPSIQKHEIPFHLVEKLVQDISENGLEGDATLLLSGAGDPLFYPELDAVLKRSIGNPNISQVILETWLTIDDFQDVEDILNLDHDEKLSIVVRLGSIDISTYKEVYGKDLLSQVLINLEKIEKRVSVINNPPKVYVEMLRMNENDSGVDAFMKKFQDTALTPILGKFNSFIDVLPDRRAIDLTPLRRDFCWHLARDFYLNVAGLVPLCKQDFACKKGKGLDFNSLGVLEISEKTLPAFEASYREEYEKTGMPCLSCDEWYTFNM